MTTAPNRPSLPKTMRAVAVDRFGDAGTLRELPRPEVGPQEMLVRVRAPGVNPLDLKARDGERQPETSASR